MSQQCYSCGRVTPYGQPLAHFFDCEVASLSGEAATLRELEQAATDPDTRIIAGILAEEAEERVREADSGCGQTSQRSRLPS